MGYDIDHYQKSLCNFIIFFLANCYYQHMLQQLSALIDINFVFSVNFLGCENLYFGVIKLTNIKWGDFRFIWF